MEVDDFDKHANVSGCQQIFKRKHALSLSRKSSSQLSAIYLQQYENKSNLKITEPKIMQSSQNTNVEISDDANSNSENQLKSVPDDEPAALLSFSCQVSQLDVEQENKGKNLEVPDEEKVKELIASNEELKKHLQHSRKRTRELLKELRVEREDKKRRREDFEMIQKLLNRYM